MGNTHYVEIPILDVARRCGIEIDSRTLGRTEVEAKCPFCGDKPGRRHLFLNIKKNMFRCYLCGTRGNSVSLYAQLQSLSNREAAQALLRDSNAVYPLPHGHGTQAQVEPPARPIAQRHAVFQAMLHHLTLSERHRENLHHRGLPDHRIERNLYRTLPLNEETRRTLAGMLADFYDLSGIPGFCRNNRGEWTIAGQPGLLIPCRDKDGFIQGVQIRLDDSSEKRKYRWLASTGRKEGTRSGSWIHVTGDTSSKTAYLTEGGLKGDVASFYDGEALFICFPGINAIGGLMDTVKALGVTRLIIAADMDKVTNWRVRNGYDNIIRAVSRLPGVTIQTANWNPSHKGIDDYYQVRSRIWDEGKTIAIQPNKITARLHELWKKKYPTQDAGFINACEWEEKLVPLSRLTIDPPKDDFDMAKAKKYVKLMEAGTDFPPLVCVNGNVIDGFHRAWALTRLGRDLVHVYQNIPWEVGKTAA